MHFGQLEDGLRFFNPMLAAIYLMLKNQFPNESSVLASSWKEFQKLQNECHRLKDVSAKVVSMIDAAERQDYHVVGGDTFRKHHEHISALIDMFDVTRKAFEFGLESIRVVGFDPSGELITDRGEKLEGRGINIEDVKAGFADADAGRHRRLADILKACCK